MSYQQQEHVGKCLEKIKDYFETPKAKQPKSDEKQNEKWREWRKEAVWESVEEGHQINQIDRQQLGGKELGGGGGKCSRC